MNQFDGARVFSMDLSNHICDERDFKNVAWILFESAVGENFVGCHHAERIARVFTEFGDYNVMRDSKDSCFIEFYSYDKDAVKGQSIDDFIEVMTERKEEFGVKEVRSYDTARKFKARILKND
jgi:hypothetical protein